MPPRVPNRFHFIFGLKKQIRRFHLIYYLCLESCLQVNKPETVYFYYHYEPHGQYWDLIKNKITPVRVEPVKFVTSYKYQSRYLKNLNYAHQADFIRLEKVVENGGVYADMDTIFVNPIPPDLYKKPFVLGKENDILDMTTQQYRPSLCNAFIMAEPGAEFGRMWLREMAEVFDGSWSRHSTLLPYELSREHPRLIHVEPVRSFYKHLWTREGLHTLLQGCDPDFDGVISMHLWSHLWWDRWRRDFSDFHSGVMTENYIRTVDTTYNLIARRYLPDNMPPKQWSFAQIALVGTEAGADIAGLLLDFKGRAKTFLKRTGITKLVRVCLNWVGKMVADAIFTAAYVTKNLRILLRVILFFPLRRLSLKYGENFIYARRQWDYRLFRKRFRDRTATDYWHLIVPITVLNEYRIEKEKFQASDVIIDIGAHIGVFSYLCHLRGSRSIYSFEPDIKNAKSFESNLRDLDGITLFQSAVFRSDLEPAYELTHSGYLNDITGGGNVIMAGRLYDFNAQEEITFPRGRRQTVPVIPLDDILARFERIKLLKVDCEGSEFPILLTSRLLGKVDRIVGEYHEVPPDAMKYLDPMAKIPRVEAYTAGLLAEKLRQERFVVKTTPTLGGLGLFEANRPRGDKGTKD